MYKLFFLTIIATCFSLVSGGLWAQTPNNGKPVKDTVKTHSLKEVAIKAGRISSRNTSATPLQVVKGAELEKLNSFSVADAIRFFSGVQLKDYGGIGGLKTINVRSLGSNHVAVFYDGVEFGNSQNGQVDLGKFSLDNIEEIALYNAQKGTIFQPAKGFAAGSSIYLTSRQPNFENGRTSTGKVSFKAGSYGLINPSFFWQYKLSDNVYSTLSTEVIHANGRYKFRYTNGVYDTTAVRQNGDIDAQRFELGFNGKLKDSSQWAVKGYLYNSERGLPAAIVSNKFDSHERLWDRDIFVQASYNKKFSETYSLMLNAKYADTYSHYKNPDITTTAGLLNDKYYEHELYFSVANKLKINDFWNVALSADYQRNTLRITENDSAKYRFVPPVRNTLLTAAATELHFERLNIQANVLGTFVNDKVPIETNSSTTTKYTPALLLSWQPTANPDLRIRGFYKSIFRLPTFNDLYYTFVGYAAVRPELNKQYDIGLTYTKTLKQQTLVYFALQADAYYNHVKDKIVAVPGADLGRWSIINLGLVDIKGIEFNAQAIWQLSGDVTLNTGLAYTYQRSVDVTNKTDYNYNQQIPYTPVNSGSALIAVEWKKLSLNYSYVYTGERYNQKTNEPANYMPPWYTHDAGLTYNTGTNKHKVKFNAQVNNLFNQYYDVVYNFPLPGRNYRIAISSTF